MTRRRGPRAHVWVEEGGMVTGTDDPAVARPLLLDAYVNERGEEDPERLARLFPIESAEVSRGRIIPAPADDECAWRWFALDADATGRGVITAVVWQVTY